MTTDSLAAVKGLLARAQTVDSILIRQLFTNTDGEAVIMLAFQASGRGSTPLQCNADVHFW